MTLVSFFTPVIQPNHPFMNAIERYTWFGGKFAEVVELNDGTKQAFLNSESSSFLATALKVSTMILSFGILPLLALIIRAISRCGESFEVPADPVVNQEIANLRQFARDWIDLSLKIAEPLSKALLHPANSDFPRPSVELKLVKEWKKKNTELLFQKNQYPGALDDLHRIYEAEINLLETKFPTIRSDLEEFDDLYLFNSTGNLLRCRPEKLTLKHTEIVINQWHEIDAYVLEFERQVFELASARMSKPATPSSIDPKLIGEFFEYLFFLTISRDNQKSPIINELQERIAARHKELDNRCPIFTETVQTILQESKEHPQWQTK